MKSPFIDKERADIRVAVGQRLGAFEWWRHSIGHGGINSLPLPDRVVRGSRKLKPRLVRTFLQEYLDIYPQHGRFDWSQSDPYLEALAATGAKVMAAITMKPQPLFPVIDQTVWQANNREEWQQVIRRLVHRYSLEKPIVTHWEIGNETDIGEWGGCPFLVNTAESYFDYYRTMVDAIREVFPGAKVGGPALAGARNPLLPGFLSLCAHAGVPIDFISWHCYNDDPAEHAELVHYINGVLEGYPRDRMELFVTEWNKGFDPVSVEEMAFEPGRAVHTAAAILSMMDAGLDGSFYYHVWDQTAFIDEFSRFFHDPTIMTIHWNEIPHRFGLFGVNEEVRPQYFVYQMLSRMGEERVNVDGGHPALTACAVRDGDNVSTLLVNGPGDNAVDLVTSLHLSGLARGRKMLKTFRIDSGHHWSDAEMELVPVEQREVDTYEEYRFCVYSPAQSVTLVTLEGIAKHPRRDENHA